MKITELQIGDWIHIEDESWNVNINARVREIEKNDEDYGLIVNERGLVFFDDTVTPIPLTAEILEKNGFWWGLTNDTEDVLSLGIGVPIVVQRSWIWEDEGGGKVVLDFPNEADGGQVWCHTDKKDSSMGWLDEIYVHELQHALKVCGLNDLADTLKIE